MVLSKRSWVVVAVVLASFGCVRRAPVQRLATRAQVVVGAVVDFERSPAQDAPTPVLQSLGTSLDERNLEPKPTSVLVEKTTARRLELLTGAPYALLVELRPVFFSQLDGRYRWTVAVKLSAKGPKGELAEEDTTLPAVLRYEHERGAEAVAAVADDVAARAGRLLDQVLAGAVPQAQGQGQGAPYYFAMVDRFANGRVENDGTVDLKDPHAFHGGDLAGVRGKLDWLQRLGVRTVWLSPVFAMRTEKFHGFGAFHGYWTWRLDRVEPRFGDEAELVALREALHARGMRLVLDLVLNHVGPDAPLVKEKPEWFHRLGGLEDWNDPEQLVMRDVHGLPDLALERPDVYASLLAATKHWLETVKPDGFRLDAVKHVPLPIWRRFNADVRALAGPKVELLGELLDGRPTVLASAWREGGFSGVFDFPLHGALQDVICRGEAPSRLAAVLTLDRLYPDPNALVTVGDNHDLPRLASVCGGSVPNIADALAVLYAVRGSPCLSWGTEVALQGAKEPENRADMRFEPHPVGELLEVLARVRRVHPAFVDGVPVVREAGADRLVLERVAKTERALLVVSRAAEPQWRPDGPWSEVPVPLTERVRLFVRGGDFAAEVPKLEAQWRKGEVTRTLQLDGPSPLLAVGSAPELGAWEPAKGLELGPGKGGVAVPVGSVLELKLVRRTATGFEWEPGGNRTVFVSEGKGPLAVPLAWRGS